MIDIGIGWRIIFNEFKEIGCDGRGWIDFTQVRVQWQALVNNEMHCQIS
jgi:hypothetical protein